MMRESDWSTWTFSIDSNCCWGIWVTSQRFNEPQRGRIDPTIRTAVVRADSMFSTEMIQSWFKVERRWKCAVSRLCVSTKMTTLPTLNTNSACRGTVLRLHDARNRVDTAETWSELQVLEAFFSTHRKNFNSQTIRLKFESIDGAGNILRQSKVKRWLMTFIVWERHWQWSQQMGNYAYLLINSRYRIPNLIK